MDYSVANVGIVGVAADDLQLLVMQESLENVLERILRALDLLLGLVLLVI